MIRNLLPQGNAYVHESANADRQWRNVTPRDPCPICGGRGWCSVRADGNLVVCRRVSTGCSKVKQDRSGAEFYLHRLAGAALAPADRRQAPMAAGPEKADADTLGRVYDALLGRLALAGRHRDNLRRRGLADDAIDRNLYRTLPEDRRQRWRIAGELHDRFAAALLAVPGFVLRDGRRGPYATIAGYPGLLVPVRDLAGRIVALKVRRDAVAEGEDRYACLSSASAGGPSCGAQPHAPLGTLAEAETVRVVEGELKADVLHLLDPSHTPTLSVPGATNWRPVLPLLDSLGCRTVRLCYDADACERLAVARALRLFAGEVAARGHSIQLEVW